jgi:hypothetical protein
MPLDGPTSFVKNAADGFAWAHYFSENYSRCPWMGPPHIYQQLPMASLGPIISLRGTADASGWAHRVCSTLLPMASLGPIISLRGAADASGWAHFVCRKCCRWLRLGPLFL